MRSTTWNFPFVVLLVLTALMLSACVRNDDEPLIPSAPISRLYVSLQEFQSDETADPYLNLAIIDPADAEVMQGSVFNSGVQEGSGVFFSPEISRIFQGSVLNQSVVLMSVTDVGIPQRSGQITNENMTAIRGLHYEHDQRMLYVANNWTPSGLYLFDNPINRNGETEALHYFPLNGVRPWGITMWDDQLLVVRTGSPGGINVYRDMTTQLKDSTDLIPSAVLDVAGANTLRGVAYSKKLDLLVLTEYDQPRLLIFEQASELFSQSQGTINPSRVIAGPETELAGPTDVAIDDREGVEALYVSDKRSKSVLRFRLDASGNARPQAKTTFTLSPEALYLDGRGLVGAVGHNGQ